MNPMHGKLPHSTESFSKLGNRTADEGTLDVV